MSIGAMIVMAIAAAALSLIVRQYRPEFSIMIALAVTAVIFISMMEKIEYIFDNLKSLFNGLGYMGEFASIILKGLGICILVQMASDTCKDAGESSIASKLEIAGKITVLFVSMPLIFKVLETATDLISKGGGA